VHGIDYLMIQGPLNNIMKCTCTMLPAWLEKRFFRLQIPNQNHGSSSGNMVLPFKDAWAQPFAQNFGGSTMNQPSYLTAA